MFGVTPGSFPLEPHQISQSPLLFVGTGIVAEPDVPFVVNAVACAVPMATSRINPIRMARIMDS